MPSKDKDLATLRWFVFRARRVAEHSLAEDRDRRMLEWPSGTMKITFVGDRPQSLETMSSDEEAVQLLVPLRPFTRAPSVGFSSRLELSHATVFAMLTLHREAHRCAIPASPRDTTAGQRLVLDLDTP